MERIELAQIIARELGVRPSQVEQTVSLLDDGNTVPFIARYRKEATGSLDEEQIRNVETRADYVRRMEDRRQTVLTSISEQDRLTPELEGRLRTASSLQEIEDLYLPYRPKRRTRAMIAREHGLEPLAQRMLQEDLRHGSLVDIAMNYVNENVPTPDLALAGARDIIAENISESSEVRQFLRQVAAQSAMLVATLSRNASDPEQKYADYYAYQERFANVPPHRLLAVNRGEQEHVLSVSLQFPEETVTRLQTMIVRYPRAIFAGEVSAATEDAFKRLLQPAIEREQRATKTEQAQAHAIRLFGANLRGLLLQPPLQRRRILAIDPGFRTGCKVAAIDQTGRFLAYETIYPHPPQKAWEQAKASLARMHEALDMDVIAIGNGTACRETESLVAEMIQDGDARAYVIVSEAGASVYSASDTARQELPQLDVSIRGAVSIARRLQDPLAELVKIDPKSIGVGLYQHDVNQKELAAALDQIVESVVNFVGVNLNTASPALLRHVSGLNARVAQAVVSHREENGPFTNRQALLGVSGLGPKAFEQAAGFLRVLDGDTPLDATPIHPESYATVAALLAALAEASGGSTGATAGIGAIQEIHAHPERIARLAQQLGVGAPTLQDIVESLLKPGRDPREDLPAPILRTDVLKMEDLQEGMVLQGTVRNVVDFGAFVDIGVKQNGLVHISQMSDHYVNHPLDVVAVGEVVTVTVLSIDRDRERIGLSLKRQE